MGHVAYARVAIFLLSLTFIESSFSMDGTPLSCEEAQAMQAELAARPPQGPLLAMPDPQPLVDEVFSRLIADPVAFRAKQAATVVPTTGLMANHFLMHTEAAEFKIILRWMSKFTEDTLSRLWELQTAPQGASAETQKEVVEFFQKLQMAQGKSCNFEKLLGLAIEFKKIFSSLRHYDEPSYPPDSGGDYDRFRPLLFLPMPVENIRSMSADERKRVKESRIFLVPI